MCPAYRRGMKPFLPNERTTTSRVRPLVRTIIANGRGPMAADQVAKDLWPDDRDTQAIIEKGVVTLAPYAALGRTNISTLIDILGPMSAAGAVLRHAIQVTFEQGGNTVAVPNSAATSTNAVFIAQGAPIPPIQLTFDAATMVPKKMALAFGMTREIVEGTNCEPFTTAVLHEKTSLGLDTIFFDSTAADTTRPQGVRYNVAAITAAAAGAGAMVADLAALVAAVAAQAVTMQNIILVASPNVVAKILLTVPNLPFKLFASAGLGASNVVLALATNTIVAAVEDIRVEVSKEATFHFEDTTPAPLSAVGTPNTVAAPVRSLYQTDCVAVRLVAHLNWVQRTASGGVAWIENVNW